MLGPHTVTVVRPGGRDEWGDNQTGDTRTDVPGCFWQPVSASEQAGSGQDVVNVTARVFMPPGTDIRATDRVQFEGRTYAVEGRPELHHTPAGPHHYEVELTDVEG